VYTISVSSRVFEWGGEDSNLRPADYESDPDELHLPAEMAKVAGQHWFHDCEDF
jgi:hypothetical protein